MTVARRQRLACWWIAAGTVLLPALVGGVPAVQGALSADDYWPAPVGAVWEYRDSRQRQRTVRVRQQEADDLAVTVVMEEAESTAAGLAATLQYMLWDGEVLLVAQTARSADGVAAPLRPLRQPLLVWSRRAAAVGACWDRAPGAAPAVQVCVEGAERVTVPAGTFDTLVTVWQFGQHGERQWRAPGVGLVRRQSLHLLPGSSNLVPAETWELVRYTGAGP